MRPTRTIEADQAVRGRRITGISRVHDAIEVRMGAVVLTGFTLPFGLIGCAGVGPASILHLIGQVVDGLTVVQDEYVAIDAGESRLAFPIGGSSGTGHESIRLVSPGDDELAIASARWTW